MYGYVESSPTNKIDPFGEFAITGCVTVYYVLAATVTIGAWGQIEIWKRLRRCDCPSLQYVWDTFTKFARSKNKIGKRDKSSSKKGAYEKAKKAGRGKEPISHPHGKNGSHYHPNVPKPKTPNAPSPHDHYYYP